MSSNRLIYDQCAYATELKESTSQIDYNIFVDKYENSKQCPVGDFTNILDFSSRVDVENELQGITRNNSKCPGQKFDPNAEFKVPAFTPPNMCSSIYYITPSNLSRPNSSMLNTNNLETFCSK